MKKDRYEDFCRQGSAIPVEKIPTKWGDVLIAEEFKSASTEFPWGAYRVVWAIERGEMDFAQELFFDAFHDPEIPFPDKRKARVNAALLNAQGWLETNVKTGRYDA